MAQKRILLLLRNRPLLSAVLGCLLAAILIALFLIPGGVIIFSPIFVILDALIIFLLFRWFFSLIPLIGLLVENILVNMGIKKSKQKQSSSIAVKEKLMQKLPIHVAFLSGLLITSGIICLMVGPTSRSMSSTAALGFLFLPAAAFALFVFFSILSGFVGMVIKGGLDKTYRTMVRWKIACGIVILAALYFIPYIVVLNQTSRHVMAIKRMTSATALQTAYDNLSRFDPFGYRIYSIAAIANNPYADSQLLDTIAHLNDPAMNEKLGSILAELTPGNERGLAAVRLVANNPNVGEKTLIYLSDSNNFYLLGDIAANRKTPISVLQKLYQRASTSQEGYLIEWGLADNKNTPVAILPGRKK